ncbi:MAG: hypothetical protein PGN27_05475 [Mycolicibacterium neoaurum]|uniref:hypothetical protein n=1 Tax=Mycolicibacterium neoaurum TaxID=1795 RepID=UPI002FF62071
MAVFFDAIGQGGNDGHPFYDSQRTEHKHVANGGDIAVLAGISYSVTDLALGPWIIWDSTLGDLTRKVSYGGVDMQPIGVIQWGGTAPGAVDAWTEVFALAGVPAGEAQVVAAVWGGMNSQRALRCQTVSYTGVHSIGTPIIASGVGNSAVTATATATAAGRIVGVFGTRSGMSGYNGSQRFLSNDGVGLLMGDAPGTGSPQGQTVTRQNDGPWAGLVVPLQAADTVATCEPLIVEPTISSRVHRAPRTGGLRRKVFKVPADFQ